MYEYTRTGIDANIYIHTNKETYMFMLAKLDMSGRQTDRSVSKDMQVPSGFGPEHFRPSLMGWAGRYGSFRKLGAPYFGVLIIRILLFRVPF